MEAGLVATVRRESIARFGEPGWGGFTGTQEGSQGRIVMSCRNPLSVPSILSLPTLWRLFMHQPRWKLKSKEVRPVIGEEVCEHLAGQVGGASRGSGNSQGGILPFLFSLLWAMGEREGEESEEKGEESLTGSLLCPWDFPGKNTGVSCYFPPQDESVLMSIPRLFSYQI